jgi:8-oxo-dGTP pyrophosphatase MutT (NUDIX family)
MTKTPQRPARKTARKAGSKAPPKPRAQYAALPWRRGEDGAVQILVITSRETRRWVIPKGWPIKGLSPAMAAAREAFEEAGVTGPIAEAPLGTYHYDKRLRSGRLRSVAVEVFSLHVDGEEVVWPEQDQREKRWSTPREAADLVDESELKTLLAGFLPPTH